MLSLSPSDSIARKQQAKIGEVLCFGLIVVGVILLWKTAGWGAALGVFVITMGYAANVERRCADDLREHIGTTPSEAFVAVEDGGGNKGPTKQEFDRLLQRVSELETQLERFGRTGQF